MSRNRVKSAPKQGHHSSRRRTRIFRFNKSFKTFNLFPGVLSQMRESLRVLTSDAAPDSNESWVLSFLSSVNRRLTTRRSVSGKLQRIKNWSTNYVDYQTLEARNLLAGSPAMLEFDFDSATALEDGTFTQAPMLVVIGDVAGTIQDRTITFTAPSGVGITPSDATVMSFTVPSGTYAGGNDPNSRFDLSDSFAIQDDSLVESDEQFTVSFDTLGMAFASTGDADGDLSIRDQVAVTIGDNDTANWSISQANTVINEGDSAVFTLDLSGTIQESETVTIDVDWSFFAPTTLADYAETLSDAITEAVNNYNPIAPGESLAWSGTTLTYTAGDDGSGGSAMTSLLIDIDTFDDTNSSQAGHLANLVEPDEQFELTISNPGGSPALVGTSGATNLNTEIQDDDSAVVSISSFQDGDEEFSTDGILQVTLSNPSQSDTVVNFTDGGLTMGTAIPGFDYTALAGNTLNFSAGEISKTLTIDPINDDLVEGPETVTLRLTSFTARDPQITIAAYPDSTASITIVDDEKATWSLTGTETVAEGAIASYTLALDGKLQAGEDAKVNLAISFPAAATSMDAAEAADFVNALLVDVATSIGLYNSGGNSGTFALEGSTLTYTHGVTDSVVDSLTIDLGISDDNPATNNLVEGAEDYELTISTPTSSTGAAVLLHETDVSVTTTITDGDTATWSLTGVGTVAESATANYSLALGGVLQAGETAKVDLAISFPTAGISMDAAETADFVNDLLVDVATSIAVYNSGQNSGMFALAGSTLTYTHGLTDGVVDSLNIGLGIGSDDPAANNLVEGSEDYTLAVSMPGSTTGSTVVVDGMNESVTTTITDGDTATWSIVGGGEVSEGGNTSYTISLDGVFAAGEDASVEITLTVGDTTSGDYDDFLTAVGTAVSEYAAGMGAGTVTFDGTNKLTFSAASQGDTMDNLVITLGVTDDSLVEGVEDFGISIADTSSGTGATVAVDASNHNVTTTITDDDTATWTLTDNNTVADTVGENATASYLLSLEGTLQAGETASVDLAISFPSAGASMDAAEGADFTNTFLSDVASAIDAYNMGGSNSGTFMLVDSTLTYTHGETDGAVDSLAIDLDTGTDSMVEGPEDFTQTISSASSTTGADIEVSSVSYTTTTTITDAESATWSLTDDNTVMNQVNEGVAASYLLSLAGFLQAGETASVNLAISFPATGSSMDAAEMADFVNGVFADVATSIVSYNMGENNGTFMLVDSTLTYTHGETDGTVNSLSINLTTDDDALVEGPEDHALTISMGGSTTGADVLISATEFTTTTTIIDNDVATWSLADNNTMANEVDEGAIASYLLSLAGTLQAGETATVDLAISYLAGGASMDAAEAADFTNALLADVATAIGVYNGGANSGSYSLTGSTLTYTHGATDDTVDDLQIALGISEDNAATNNLVEGSEDFALTISSGTSTTGASIEVSQSAFTTTTTINDTDTATWALADNNIVADTVAEGTTASYLLSLEGTLQAGETASVDLAISFPSAGTSMDAAEGADFTNTFLTEVATAVTTYNMGGHSGTFALAGNTLTYTHGATDGTVDDLQIALGISDDNAATNNLVEGGEDFKLTISSASSSTGANVEVSTVADTTTTTITDKDFATWSITDFNTVANEINEGDVASYQLSLDGFFQAGETASMDLAISFPATGPNGSTADFVNSMLVDVATAIVSYNMGGNNGTFALSGNTLTYTHGETDGTVDNMQFSLVSNNDALVESFEDFTLTISAGGSSTGADVRIDPIENTVTTTINDNDNTDWSITQFASLVNEGDSAVYTLTLAGLIQDGETVTVDFDRTLLGIASLADFSETLSEAIAAAVSDYNTAAVDGDTLAWDGTTLTYTGGNDGNGGTVMIPLTIDLNTFEDTNTSQPDHLANLVEPDEDFEVTISNQGGSVASQFTSTDPITLVATIQDDDSAIVTITNIQVAEEDPTGFGTDGLFEFTLSNPSQTDTFVNFTDGGPTAGTADPGFDYVGILSSGLNFGAGETSKILSVDPIDDQVVEGPETVTIRLTGFTTRDPQITIASSPDNMATTEIIDNDNTVLTVGDAIINEAEGTATISVTLGKAVQNGFTVPYMFGDGADSAVGGIDYDDAGGTVAFAGTAGEVQMITIPINNEGDVEVNELFTVKLGEAVPNTDTLPANLIDTSDSGSVTINNDDIDVDLGAATTASQVEGNTGTTDYTFEVTRTGLTTGTTTVNWAVTGSGTNPADAADFGGTFPTGTVTFNPGETTQTITVSVSGDSTVEANEDFKVTLSTPADDDPNTDTVEIVTAAQSATVENEDSAVLTVEDVSVNEAAGLATVTISVDHAVQGGFSVDYLTSNGSAGSTSDYDPAAGTLTFSGDAGEMKTFTITINNEADVESDETINVDLGAISGTMPASIAADIDNSDNAVVTINNDDIDVDLGAATTASQVEGNTGTTDYTFEVTRTGLTTGTTTVNWAVTGSGTNPADAADFGGTFPTGTVTFNPGETTQTITVSVSGDSTVEANEDFKVTLSTPADDDPNTDTVEIVTAAQSATVENEDSAVLTVEDVSVNEAAGLATVTISVDHAVQGGFSVDYLTSNGSAGSTSDYDPAAGTLTFSGDAGEMKTFTITINNDMIVEGNETINVDLGIVSGTTPASIAAGIDNSDGAVVTVLNDDSASVSVGSPTFNEADGVVTIDVQLTGDVQDGFTVDAELTDITTASGDIIAMFTQPLTFLGNNDEIRTVTIEIFDDTVVEANETLNISLDNLSPTTASAAWIDSTSVGTVTIDNNDMASLSVGSPTFDEADGTVTIDVTLNGDVQDGFIVDGRLANITTASNDISAAASQNLTFLGNDAEVQTVTIAIVNDNVVEADEILEVSLDNLIPSTASAASINFTSIGTVTIDNNDTADVTIADLVVQEPDTGNPNAIATFTISLSRIADQDITLEVETADGTATAGSDYQSNTQTVTILAGQTTGTFSVDVFGDNLVELDESILVDLSDPAYNGIGFNGTMGGPSAGSGVAQVHIIDAQGVGIINNEDALVEFNENSSEQNELAATGAGPVIVVYGDLTGTTDVERTITMQAVSGTALEGTDFNFTNSFTVPEADYSGTLGMFDLTKYDQFGELSASSGLPAVLDIVNDNLIEGAENTTILILGFGVALQQGDANMNSVNQFNANHVIGDNDTATITIAPMQTLNEEAGTQNIEVILNTDDGDGGNAILAPGVSLSVDIVDDGTGTAGSSSDYSFSAQTITFNAGDGDGATTTAQITVTSDSTVEADETIDLDVTNLASTTGSSQVTELTGDAVTITNDEIATLTVVDVTRNEADGTATVTVSVDNAVQAGFMIDYETDDGTATVSSDYVYASGTFTFDGTAGEMKTFIISIIEDGTVEGNETIDVLLSNVVGVSVPATSFDDSDIGVVTIENNDTATLTVTDVTINESDLTALVTVTVDNEVQGGFSVDFAALDGTANAGIDYTSANATLTFAGTAGETESFTVAITNDMTVETDETVSIQLFNVDPTEALESAFDSSDTATVTINNDDLAVLSVADVSITEHNSTATVTVMLDNGVQSGFSVDFATSDSTANHLIDYLATSGTLIFAGMAGETQSFEVTIKEDSAIETNETFIAILSDIVAFEVDEANIDGTDTAVVTIVDDESLTQIGESGHLTGINHEWTRVSLNRTYENPVVIAGPASTVGSNPLVVRVRKVQSNSFEIRIDEWDYQDEFHANESVDYMVIEAGTHLLGDGTVITAGNQFIDTSWTHVDSGNEGGIVLTTVVTDNDDASITTRVRNLGSSFSVQLQEEQAADGVHGYEKVSWIQFGSGAGNLNGLQYIASETSTVVSHDEYAIEFGDDFGAAPVFLAGMQTTLGPDPATVRRTTISGTEAVVFLEEEQSADTEVFHLAENVGFLAISSGVIEAVTANEGKVGETGVVSLGHTWAQVNFSQPYENPVVIMGSLSTVGHQGATPRVRNVTATGFEVRVQEWDYLDGLHAAESVGYMVMEAGLHILEDGTTITVGTTAGVVENFQRINFPNAFDSTPLVLSQVVSENDASAVVTRHRQVARHGFNVRLQSEEAGSAHGAEQVNWIAIDQTTGVNNSLLFESGTTGNVVDHTDFDLTFGQTYNSTPALFAQMQTFNGSDTSVIRYRNLDQDSSLIFLQEEQSQDTELTHGQENVGFLAFEVGSIFSINRTWTLPAPPDQGLFSNGQIFEEFAQHFVSVLPDYGSNWATESVIPDIQKRQTSNQSELAGAVRLIDADTDAAFADFSEFDVATENDFFESLKQESVRQKI